jgi:CelD/BcsL family acetyltransferase involved in cellulose biosynthesis
MIPLMHQPDISSKVLPLRTNKLSLHAGPAVFHLLEDEDFQAGWDQLYETCPWATAFQSRAYVSAWYRLYQEAYHPIVVCWEESGKLRGLLTLARDTKGLITGAGASQAEYQVWLATEPNGEQFIKNALAEIQKHYPGNRIRFSYVPAHTPLAWTEQDPQWKKQCMVRAVRQPVLQINEDHVARELKKKNRREKINRLNRLGKLEFQLVTDAQEFAFLIDRLVVQYDFRQGARFNKSFFRADPLRKTFLLQLFAHGLLHVSVLKVGAEIIAANAGVSGKDWVHLQGFNTYAPQYARYSPGILHFLMLGRQLATEGIGVFDLTPGEDAYKHDLASAYNTVHELSITPPFHRLVQHTRLSLRNFLKKGFSALGINPAGQKKAKRKTLLLKGKLSLLKAQGPASFVKNLWQQAGAGHLSEYLASKDIMSRLSSSLVIGRDSLEDLLDFEARGTWVTRWEFLETAMHRLEAGQHAYTWSEGGRLLGCAWLEEGPTPGKVEPSPGGTLWLQQVYCHPEGRARLEGFLASVAVHAAQDQPHQPLSALVPVRDRALCRALEAIGFQKVKAT